MTNDYSTVIEKTKDWLKDNTKIYAFKKLEKEIIKTEVCVECGQCVAICPENALTGITESGKYIPTLTGKCDACGLCYAMCPRTKSSQDELIGSYLQILKIRAVKRAAKSQDGGAATAFLETLLENGIASNAVVACQSDEPWRPYARLVADASELHDCAGTLYTHAPIVNILLDAYQSGKKNLAVVGTACNMEAVSKMESYLLRNAGKDSGFEAFKIGLFCMESFEYPGLVGFLNDADIKVEDIDKMAISGGKFKINYNDKELEWPIADLDHIAAKSCSVCRDFTARTADISCGNVGSDEGWSTVIIRTERGMQLLKLAKNKGKIEFEELDDKGIVIVGNVARSKATKHYKK